MWRLWKDGELADLVVPEAANPRRILFHKTGERNRAPSDSIELPNFCMTDDVKNKQKPKRSSWVRKLGIVGVVLIALLAALYVSATSSAFLKSFVLPRVAAAIGADLSVGDVSLSPFSQVVLQKVRVHTIGTEPLLTADEAKVRFDLLAILHGNIDLQEVTLVAPSIQITTSADGKSNLDPLLGNAGTKPDKAQKSAAAIRLNVKNVVLKNGKARMVTQAKDGSARTIEIENLNVALDQLRNGGSGKIKLSSDLKFEQATPSGKPMTTDRAQAKLGGDIELALDAQLMPGAVKGGLRFDLGKTEGSFKDLAGLSGTLQADTTLNEVRQLALRFERGGKGLGSILASGPFNLEKREARLNLQVQSIDRQVLNLFGASRGWDFGESTLNTTNNIEISQKGSLINATGSLTGNHIEIRQVGGASPPLDLSLNYQVNVNLDQKTASIQKLDLAGRNNQKELLSASLDRPMNLNWGAMATSIPDSTLKIGLSDFDLQSWRVLLGTNIPNGRVDFQWTVQSQQDGKKLGTKLSGDVRELSARFGTNVIEKAQARFQISGQVQNLQLVDIDSYRFEILLNNQIVASDSGNFHGDLSKKEFNLKSDSEASLPDLLRSFPFPKLAVSTGRLKGSSVISHTSQRHVESAKWQLANFTGRFGDFSLRDFQTSIDYGMNLADNTIDLQKLNLAFSEGGRPAGNIDLSGRYQMSNGVAQVAFKIANLNQELLRPFAAPSLGDLQLLSVALNGQGSANYDPKNESSVKADFAIANWAMKDAKAGFPAQPINGRIQVDGSMRQNAIDVRQLAVDFQQGNAKPSHLDLKGRYDLTNQAGNVAFNITQIDQAILGPFVAPFLGKTKLVSVVVNGQGTASFDPKTSSAVKGEIKINRLALDDPQNRFPKSPLDARIQLDGSVRQPDVEIRQLLFDISQGTASAGHIDLTGKLNLTNLTGAGRFKISDFDQTVFRPLLAPALGGNSLLSIGVSGSGSASYDPKGDAVLAADLSVTNLVVTSPKSRTTHAPLNAQMQLDSSVRKQAIQLKRVALNLSPTDRAKNQMQLQGKLDLSATNATPSQLSFQAESLDLTPYYDLFAGSSSTNQAKPTSPGAAQTGEPPPIHLPIQQMTADLKINRCFLREVAITNLQATVKIDRDEFSLKPLQFVLNGAPVDGGALVNLGVPGYKYDLTLKADKVPLEPLARSFSPDTSGRMQGVLLADVKVKGAGTTGENLKKNLNGQVSLSLTNLNLDIVGKKTKALLEPIALVLRVPELTLTPLEWVSAKGDVGSGKINVSQFTVTSQAFAASGQGAVQIASILTNSTLNIPVTLSLRRSLAEKAHLVPNGTSANATYVQLPSFAKLAGTLGEPKTDIDKLVISGLLLQSAGGIPRVGGKTGDVLQGIGGLLSGQRPSLVNTNLPAGTNSNSAAPTNKPAKISPLDLLNLLPRKK